MKKFISISLALLMLFSFAGCSLFSDNTLVKFDDTHSHNDPEGLTYDSRVVLKNDKFAEYLEDSVNTAAYPDNVVYDDDGNMIGMYDYNPETGLAIGWTDFNNGTYVAFDEGKEVNLGKPDASKMIDIKGDVLFGSVVYGNEEKAIANYMYLFLADAADKDLVKKSMLEVFGLEFEDDSDTTLKFVQDEAAIDADFQSLIDAGENVTAKNADMYAEIVCVTYNARKYLGENPYKPFSDYEAPTDLDYDKKVVLVGGPENAIEEGYISCLECKTDVLYGKEGKLVGHYTYYTCVDKESADKIENYFKQYDGEVVRTTDTVVSYSFVGKALEDIIAQYKGYNVLTDDNIDNYATMIEESYYAVICE